MLFADSLIKKTLIVQIFPIDRYSKHRNISQLRFHFYRRINRRHSINNQVRDVIMPNLEITLILGRIIYTYIVCTTDVCWQMHKKSSDVYSCVSIMDMLRNLKVSVREPSTFQSSVPNLRLTYSLSKVTVNVEPCLNQFYNILVISVPWVFSIIILTQMFKFNMLGQIYSLCVVLCCCHIWLHSKVLSIKTKTEQYKHENIHWCHAILCDVHDLHALINKNILQGQYQLLNIR